MDESIKAYLFDIFNSIKEIEGYFSDTPKTFENYLQDIKTKRAVERNLEIIGEAVYRILKVDPQFSLTHSKKIIATRNRIIHGYDAISDELIWAIVINHLPQLQEEIKNYLELSS